MKKFLLFTSIIFTDYVVLSASYQTPRVNAQNNVMASPQSQRMMNSLNTMIAVRDNYTSEIEQLFFGRGSQKNENQHELSTSAFMPPNTQSTPQTPCIHEQQNTLTQKGQNTNGIAYRTRMERIIKQIIKLGSYQYQHYQKLNASVKTLHETLEEFRSNKQTKPTTGATGLDHNCLTNINTNKIQYIILTDSKINTLALYIKELTEKTFELRSNLDNIQKALCENQIQDQENDNQQQNDQDHQNYNNIPNKIEGLKRQITSLQQQLKDQKQQLNNKTAKDQKLQGTIQQQIQDLQTQQQTAQQDHSQQSLEEDKKNKASESETPEEPNNKPQEPLTLQKIQKEQQQELGKIQNERDQYQNQYQQKLHELQEQSEKDNNESIKQLFEIIKLQQEQITKLRTQTLELTKQKNDFQILACFGDTSLETLKGSIKESLKEQGEEQAEEVEEE